MLSVRAKDKLVPDGESSPSDTTPLNANNTKKSVNFENKEHDEPFQDEINPLDITQPRNSNLSTENSNDLPTPPRTSQGNGNYGTLIPPKGLIPHPNHEEDYEPSMERTNVESVRSVTSISNLPELYPTDGPGLFSDNDDLVGSIYHAGAQFAPLSLNRAHSLMRMSHLSPGSPKMSGPKPTLRKTQSSFWEDAMNFTEGTIPQSIVIALCVGVVCGVAAFIYYTILFAALEWIWHTLPQRFIVDQWDESLHVLWIPIVGFVMSILVGLTVVFLGEPGDLACEFLFTCCSIVLPR